MPTALTYAQLELSHDVLPIGAEAVAWAEHRRFTSLSALDQAHELLANAEHAVAVAEAMLVHPADVNLTRWRRERLAGAMALRAQCEERVAAGGCPADELLVAMAAE